VKQSFSNKPTVYRFADSGAAVGEILYVLIVHCPFSLTAKGAKKRNQKKRRWGVSPSADGDKDSVLDLQAFEKA